MALRIKCRRIPNAIITRKRKTKINRIVLTMEVHHPVNPQPLNVSLNQSSDSCFTCPIKVFMSRRAAWMLGAFKVRFRQQSPSNSWHSCPCSSRRKSMAARFWSVACLVICSSSRREVMAVDVKFACLTTQHSRWPNSPRALAAATHGRNMDTAILFDLAQWKISESQSLSKLSALSFGFYSLIYFYQSNL